MNDELLVGYLLEEISEAQRARVDRWITASPANQRYFDHFRLIWETSSRIVIPPTVNEEDAWIRFQQRTRQGKPAPSIVRSMNSGFNWKRAAAILIISIGALGLSYFLWDRLSSSPVMIASAASTVEKTLPDGSTVTLNKNSSISYAGRLKGGKRKIRLKGEAFFHVTPNKEKPFVVEVNDITVTVVGTSFNVKNINGQTEVVVETGIVNVTRNNRTVTLRPLEKVILDPSDTSMKKLETSDKLYNYYRSKEFVCDNTPLWKLVEVLNEAYDAKIIIENKALRDYPLTTTFHDESLDNVLVIIAETFNISVERRGNEILLK